MKKKIIGLVLVLIIIFLFLYFYFTKIYMNDKNLLNRYLNSKGYSCIEDTCTLKKDNTKYVMDVKTKEFYVSNNKYNLSIGDGYPSLKIKSGNKKCVYQMNDYKVGDLITEEFSYDKGCETYIKEVNKYIKDYMTILVEADVKF